MLTNAISGLLLIASWQRFSDAGLIAANGHPFNPASMCCATRKFKIGQWLHVTDLHNGLSVDVLVADKPSLKYKDRIDLSPAAFEHLNSLPLGVCEVSVKAVQK